MLFFVYSYYSFSDFQLQTPTLLRKWRTIMRSDLLAWPCESSLYDRCSLGIRLWNFLPKWLSCCKSKLFNVFMIIIKTHGQRTLCLLTSGMLTNEKGPSYCSGYTVVLYCNLLMRRTSLMSVSLCWHHAFGQDNLGARLSAVFSPSSAFQNVTPSTFLQSIKVIALNTFCISFRDVPF